MSHRQPILSCVQQREAVCSSRLPPPLLADLRTALDTTLLYLASSPPKSLRDHTLLRNLIEIKIGSMVQLHTFNPFDEAGPADYWKLDSARHCQTRGLRQKLEKHGHSASKSGCGTTARLRALYIRCQRGLLSFEGLSLHELRHFATLRGIVVDPDATATIVKAQLEKADSEATFDRFTELPPEIRQIIFQYYFESLPSSERALRKYQPPITMVSRLIRAESLPLFYDCCGRLEVLSDGPVTVPYKLNPSFTTKRFLQCTPIHLLARIKSLELCFENLDAFMIIDLRTGSDPIGNFNIDREGYYYWDSSVDAQARRQRLISAVRALATSIAARPGSLKLRLSYIEEVGEVVRSILDG